MPDSDFFAKCPSCQLTAGTSPGKIHMYVNLAGNRVSPVVFEMKRSETRVFLKLKISETIENFLKLFRTF
jgi:hypothetical protein